MLNSKTRKLIAAALVATTMVAAAPTTVLALDGNVNTEIETVAPMSYDEALAGLETAKIEADNALSSLETLDFTKRGTFEHMSSYIRAAVDRANGAIANGIEDERINYVFQALDKVNRSYNSIVARVQHAITGLETQFANGTLAGKEIAVQQFDQIIKEEEALNYEYVNKTTIEIAKKILFDYQLKLELARAVHEANIANDVLKNADFTQYGNWEYMASFISAAVGRVDGVRFNGIENQDTKYVYDTLNSVNRSYNSIVGRIQHAIAGVKLQFEQGGREGQEIAVQQLEQIINEEVALNYEYVNETTIASATGILNEYKDKLDTVEVTTYEVDVELLQQLDTAVEEANTALNHLATADFTKRGEWEYMASFIGAAVDRVNGVRFNIDNGNLAITPEIQEDITFVYEALDKINRSYNSLIGRIQHAISGLEVQFQHGGLQGKEIAWAQFDQIIKEEEALSYEYANKTTIESAKKILFDYQLKLELARAIHEADIVNERLKNADFTQNGQWEYMASFIGAAVNRVDGVRANGIYTEDTQYVYDTLGKVNEQYSSIIGRINHAIAGVKLQFEQGAAEGQKIALDQLEQIIKEETALGLVNEATLKSAQKVYDQYSNR